METLPIMKKAALEAHANADQKGKALLEDLFGKKIFSNDIMDRVKSWLDACYIKGIDPIKSLPFSNPENKSEESVNDFFKATIICEVLNEGWRPNWDNSSEYKYYPWFDMRSSAGGFSYYGYANALAYSGVGSRLVFKTEKLAKYAGTQFLEVYRGFMVI